MAEVLEQSVVRSPSTRPIDLRWKQVLSHLDPKYGGISTVVPELAAALATQGIACEVDAFCASGESFHPSAMDKRSVHFWPIARANWLRSATLRRSFSSSVTAVDGLHVHGLWDSTSWMSFRAARRHNKPYVLSAHGMLEPWALRQGRVKKRMYAAAVEHDVIHNAHCLHALTEAEALQYRHFGSGATPVVVIPNGVAVPATLNAEPFLQMFPALRGCRIALFLARLHVKKGVDLLVEAWLEIRRMFPEAVLVIAGPDSGRMRAHLEARVAADGGGSQVVFAGLLSPMEKWSAFAAAELMVLPSHSEGLSMSVLEAMGAGVPVLLTPQCNMPWVEQAGAGWLTEPTVGALAASLASVLRQGTARNAIAGVAGRHKIAAEYSWSVIAARMAEVYRWVAGGPLPVLSEVLR